MPIQYSLFMCVCVCSEGIDILDSFTYFGSGA